jgi:hypothetical protein
MGSEKQLDLVYAPTLTMYMNTETTSSNMFTAGGHLSLPQLTWANALGAS